MKRLIILFCCICSYLFADDLKRVEYEYKKSVFDAMTKEQVIKRRDMLAEVWDWQHPGRLAAPPAGYSVTNKNAKQEFGAHLDVGYYTFTNKAGEAWVKYKISELQTDNRSTEKIMGDTEKALNISTNDIKFIKDGKIIKPTISVIE